MVWVDGHSDYGHALSVFYDRWAGEISNRTSEMCIRDRPVADREGWTGRSRQRQLPFEPASRPRLRRAG